jgi:uncharacterized protein YPO0396
MTDALFSAVEMAVTTADDLPGFRLDRLELLNWGTFDQRVWTFRPGGRNGLLTGDIGSGKSTIVDAVTTLLLPAHRISYNKAAGAETRERSLRSYVLGHHKSQRNEETGSSQPVSLRDATAYSVLLGVFVNQGYGSLLTCAQVFWMGDAGQPDRFYVTADRDMSIAADFADFGGDIKALKRRLRSDGARTFDRFPEYGRDFRRRLGIASEQAMELFHQTVSMKSVGDLNEFVRRHMLEPFDSVSWTEKLITHFDDLTHAHEAVRRAQDQLAALRPLLDDCDAHDRLRDEINALDGQRAALPFFFAERKAELLATRCAALETELKTERAGLKALGEQLALLRDRATALTMRRDGLGGARLSELDRLIKDAAAARDDRRGRARRHADLLASAGLAPVETAQEFIARLHEIDQAQKSSEWRRTKQQERIDELGIELQRLRQEASDLNGELKSLRARRNNIPRRTLELRGWLSRELNVRESELPFAGELIRVRPEDEAWEGAAERLLRGFALSMLVPQEHYPAVSDWINEHHLGTRLVYYRVPADVEPWPARTESPDALASKLETKGGPFAPWLDRELARRADYGCVETMDDFRRLPRAVTLAGQVKGSGGRHEKNDTDQQPAGESQRPNEAVLTPVTGGHDIPVAISSPGRPTGARSFSRTRGPGSVSAHLSAGCHARVCLKQTRYLSLGSLMATWWGVIWAANGHAALMVGRRPRGSRRFADCGVP